MSRFVSVGVSILGNASKNRNSGQKIMRGKQLGDCERSKGEAFGSS
jgi:hypothetical protein